MVEPNYDAWREVVNGADTFAAIAADLRELGSCIIGWTDGEGSHHDVLFTLRPPQHGSLAGGLRGSRDLFVSVMRWGAFGFDCDRRAQRHPDYIAEKLAQPHDDATTRRLAELISGVIAELNREALPEAAHA